MPYDGALLEDLEPFSTEKEAARFLLSLPVDAVDAAARKWDWEQGRSADAALMPDGRVCLAPRDEDGEYATESDLIEFAESLRAAEMRRAA
jgi:hypothetical protein